MPPTPTTVPIVSKKSLSMIEKVARAAVTTPSLPTNPKSSRPKVEKSGARTMAVGRRAAPGVAKPCQPAKRPLAAIARTVVRTMPSSSAPGTRRAMNQAVRTKPQRKTRIGRPRNSPKPTGRGLEAGFTTKPDVKNPMKAMKSPIPTPIARLRPSGTASSTASRNRVSTRRVMTSPSTKMTVMAWGQVSPRDATSSNATTALSPMPGASANG